jgi:hypothetical protein
VVSRFLEQPFSGGEEGEAHAELFACGAQGVFGSAALGLDLFGEAGAPRLEPVRFGAMLLGLWTMAIRSFAWKAVEDFFLSGKRPRRDGSTSRG